MVLKNQLRVFSKYFEKRDMFSKSLGKIPSPTTPPQGGGGPWGVGGVEEDIFPNDFENRDPSFQNIRKRVTRSCFFKISIYQFFQTTNIS